MELLAALEDPDVAVQAVAWESLIRPAGIMIMCGFRPLLRATPPRDLLAALITTKCKAACQELFWEIAERDQGDGVRAACHILSQSADWLSTENVMYWIGAPSSFGGGLVVDGFVPCGDARRIAQRGLENPDATLRVRCSRFLIMLGGGDLSEADGEWIDLATVSGGLACLSMDWARGLRLAVGALLASSLLLFGRGVLRRDASSGPSLT